MSEYMYVIVRTIGYSDNIGKDGYLRDDSLKEIYSVCDNKDDAREHINRIKDMTINLIKENNEDYEVKDIKDGSLFIIDVKNKEDNSNNIRFEIGMKRYKLNALE